MPSLKKLTKELRQEIVSYLFPFPTLSSNLAFRLATLIFAKTRFCSHINFIGRCLNSKVIPKGFRSNFHASTFSHSNQYLHQIRCAQNSFSRNIMRITIRAMCHPSHVKNSIPYSQFLRLRRLCSDDSDFSSKSEEMCQFFEKRGYPVSVVKAGHHRAQQFDRQSSLQTSQKDKNDRIPFTLTFHPHNHAVKSIILSNFKLLQNDPETGRIFSQPPLISFKRDKNVGNFLVRSALKTNEQPGTFKCARSRCNTCRFIVNTSKISGPKRSVKITDRFTCTSANVIYCITCTLCNKLYIGETGRRLGDRFREHLRDVEKNDKDASKPVARHFNLPNHSKKHMAVCGLSLHLGTTESRKNLEQKFIFQIGTLNPHGINERFSFN